MDKLVIAMYRLCDQSRVLRTITGAPVSFHRALSYENHRHNQVDLPASSWLCEVDTDNIMFTGDSID